MFTGIVEELGTVECIRQSGACGTLEIRASGVLAGTAVGDSIAVNGVCLTVTKIASAGIFSADVMGETLRHSSLGSLSRGNRVNLERAMAADGRFGGHLVSGHIDGVGTVRELWPEGNAVLVTVKAPPQILELIVERGSIAIDGVSLTVCRIDPHSFQVSLIPHTANSTTLLTKHPGDPVNLENDMVGKYVKKLLAGGPMAGEAGTFPVEAGTASTAGKDLKTETACGTEASRGMTEAFLRENGF